MADYLRFFINGEWVNSTGSTTLQVINPATEEPICKIAMGTNEDVDLGVEAARKAFKSFSLTTPEQRIELIDAIVDVYKKRYGEIAAAISAEMGAPITFATKVQAATGIGHFKSASKILKTYDFENQQGTTLIRKEPIGVCGLITPWNWPMNQIACKVAPALAAGCTMILKPSEVAPISAILLAEIMDEAGVPPGVFNLINGDGPIVGEAMSAHPEIDMMSFTGSTVAGIAVAKASAPSVKRVCQELGGKSANIILSDADFKRAVKGGVMGCMMNSGQSCNAPTRMLVPSDKMEEAVEIARDTAEGIIVGDPTHDSTTIGPVVNEVQFQKIQALIKKGIEEGANLITGGVDRPDGLERGYFVKPTIFGNVTNDMTIAQEEIFGPVLSIMAYKDKDEAIQIANDTVYGLSGYISSSNIENARELAARLRTGNVHINNTIADPSIPFGGYKQSGNGREWGQFGLEEFLEVKAIIGGFTPE